MIIAIITASIVLLILVITIVALFVRANKIHKSIFGQRFTPSPLIKFYTKEEFNLSSEAVEIPCKKNIIRGNLYHYDNYDSDKVVVFCHGMGSNQNSYLQDIEYLCRNNLLVLGFDYIGVSSSDGKNIQGLSNSLRCADYAVSYIEKKYPGKHIYVIGHSWGGFATANIIKYHPNIKGIIPLASFRSIKECYKHFLTKKNWFMIPFLMIIEHISIGNYVYSKTEKSLKNYKNKAFFIASVDDPDVSCKDNTLYIQEKYPNFNYLILNNKKHNPTYKDEAVVKLVNFLDTVKTVKEDEMVEYMNSINFHELGELDPMVMDKIVSFIKD